MLLNEEGMPNRSSEALPRPEEWRRYAKPIDYAHIIATRELSWSWKKIKANEARKNGENLILKNEYDTSNHILQDARKEDLKRKKGNASQPSDEPSFHFVPSPASIASLPQLVT